MLVMRRCSIVLLAAPSLTTVIPLGFEARLFGLSVGLMTPLQVLLSSAGGRRAFKILSKLAHLVHPRIAVP